MTSEVGMLLAPPAKESLFVSSMASGCPVGTVITTGDQPPPAFGFNALQEADETAEAQL
jgi:hypothetical protein